MSKRNTREAKASRRRARQVRHVGGCAVCGTKVVAWVDEHTAADPTYRAICNGHLGHALGTLYGYPREGRSSRRLSETEHRELIELMHLEVILKRPPPDPLADIRAAVDLAMSRQGGAGGA